MADDELSIHQGRDLKSHKISEKRVRLRIQMLTQGHISFIIHDQSPRDHTPIHQSCHEQSCPGVEKLVGTQSTDSKFLANASL